jgi:hypothetical protein
MSSEPKIIEKFIYPHLLPLQLYSQATLDKNSSSKDEQEICASIVKEAIALRRDAMIISQSKHFLMDTGLDIFIYRYAHLLSCITRSILNFRHRSMPMHETFFHLNERRLIENATKSEPSQDDGFAYNHRIPIHRSTPFSPSSNNLDTGANIQPGETSASEKSIEPEIDEALIFAPTWIRNGIINRIANNPIPQRIHFANSGSLSSDAFRLNLIEDVPVGFGEPCYTDFVEAIIELAIKSYSSG